MCYVNSGVLNSGKSKNYIHFHFLNIPCRLLAPFLPQPLQGRPQEGGWGHTWGIESYTTK